MALALPSVWAMSPAELQQKLEAREKLTLIDVRRARAFEQGHIPNAINIPAALLATKQLPPLGSVVVYDAGQGDDLVTAAVAALNGKPGISAQPLDGGFAAWETAAGATTARAGLARESLPMISYEKLKAAPADDLVLVDLRQANAADKPAAKTASPALTDLSAEFPKMKVTRSPFAVVSPRKAGAAMAGAKPPLLVLIDSGNGAAEEMARTLKANGIKRFVILAGGEVMLARKGQAGLQRVGSSTLQPGTAVPTNR